MDEDEITSNDKNLSLFTVGRGDKVLGEFSAEEIKGKVDAGDLLTSDLVYTEGYDDWKTIAEAPELQTANPKTPQTEDPEHGKEDPEQGKEDPEQGKEDPENGK